MPKNVLLEIGTEEIPTSYIEPALDQLREHSMNALGMHNLTYKDIKTYATPRRLCLIVEKLDEKSQDRVEEYFGPTVKVGRDANGNYTPAAKGFAAKYGVAPEKLVVKQKEKGEYFCVQIKIPGVKSEQVLKDILPEIIGRLSFPKSMVWEPSGFKFARPIRTVIALHGEKVIKFAIAGVKSGNLAVGLHTIYRKKIAVRSPERYMPTLRNNCIIVDPQERKAIISKVVESSAKRIKADALLDEDLLSEVTYLVEHPVAILGSYNDKFLKLPKEVLINCMQKKQKFFPIVDDKGNLINSFVGVRNGISENQNVVKEGYERVLTARLQDAEFFFNQDTRTPLCEKIDKLKGVVFQQKLGTVYDKVSRIKQLAGHINNLLEVDQIQLEKACDLAKADLVTDMVFEYPEMQGIVGRIYAEVDKETREVARSIEEHYWPLTNDSNLPETKTATILALADKLDTLVGYFAVGLVPSGSQDPYGLRRISTGIIRVILEKHLNTSLSDLVDKAYSFLPEKTKQNQEAKTQVMEFLKQRLENILEGNGHRFDEVRSVLSCGFDDLVDAEARLNALKKIRTLPDFDPLAAAFKRTANILKQASKKNIDIPDRIEASLLKEDAETRLYSDVCKMESDIQSYFDNKDYVSVLKEMVSLKPSVDIFFDKVMVMAEDASLRTNRLGLLNYIKTLFFKVLDFSLLQ